MRACENIIVITRITAFTGAFTRARPWEDYVPGSLIFSLEAAPLFAAVQTRNESVQVCGRGQGPAARTCGPAALLPPRTLTRQAWVSLWTYFCRTHGARWSDRAGPRRARTWFSLLFSSRPPLSFPALFPPPSRSPSTRRLHPHLIWLFIIREFRDSVLCIALSSPPLPSFSTSIPPPRSHSLLPPLLLFCFRPLACSFRN